MDHITYDERLNYLAELAVKGRLQSLAQVAEKFSCSERTVKRMLYHLRYKGINVHYSPALKKFIIKPTGDI